MLTRNPEIEALAALAVYANRPSSLTTSHQAAVSVVGTDASITVKAPPDNEYEDAALALAAPPKASETKT